MITRKGIALPDDFANALKNTEAALAVFEAMPPSHQHEYVQAIEEAKRPETRQRRITGAIEMILKWDQERHNRKKTDRTAHPGEKEGSSQCGSPGTKDKGRELNYLERVG